jgi:hypothetical protein
MNCLFERVRRRRSCRGRGVSDPHVGEPRALPMAFVSRTGEDVYASALVLGWSHPSHEPFASRRGAAEGCPTRPFHAPSKPHTRSSLGHARQTPCTPYDGWSRAARCSRHSGQWSCSSRTGKSAASNSAIKSSGTDFQRVIPTVRTLWWVRQYFNQEGVMRISMGFPAMPFYVCGCTRPRAPVTPHDCGGSRWGARSPGASPRTTQCGLTASATVTGSWPLTRGSASGAAAMHGGTQSGAVCTMTSRTMTMVPTTPRRVRATARQAETVTRTWWRAVRDYG